MANARILVVEDEAIVAKDVQSRLEGLGYAVPAIASSGEQAVRRAAATQPDLVLMDIRIKGEMDGVEAAGQVRDRFNIPVIYVTAYADDATLERAKITEPFGYILKPFETRELHCAIEMALYKHEAGELVKASLREKEALLREIHHRVKNNLQVISSLLSLQAGRVKDKQALEMFRDSQSRVKSLAMIHEKLYRSTDLARINFADYIEGLIVDLYHLYAINPEVITTKIDVHDVSLDIGTAVPCGLIICELLSNSLKHAFPGGRKGEVRVDLRSADGNKLALVVADDGVGLPKGLDFRKTESLGLQLVCTLADQLGGAIELGSSGGSEFKVVFPASKQRESD